MDEKAYIEGSNAAWRRMLQECLSNLPEERPAHAWQLERGAAILALRELCEEFGDNDWPDSLHLADIIEKHLGRNLRARESK